MNPPINKVVASGTVWFSVSTVLVKLLGAMTVFLILRKLTVFDYGVLELVMSLVAIAGLFLLPGLSDQLVADLGVFKAQKNLSLLRTHFHAYAVLSFTVAFLLWAVFFTASFFLDTLLPQSGADVLLRISSFLFLVSPLRSILQVVFSYNLRYFQQSAHSMLEEMIKLFSVAYFLYWLQIGYIGVIWATLCSQVLAILVLSPTLIRDLRFVYHAPPEPSRRPIWFLLGGVGIWSVSSTYLNTFAQNVRLWIIRIMLGTEAVGLYAVANGLINHTVSLFPLHRVVTPLLSRYRDDIAHFTRLLNKSLKYQLLGSVLIGVFAAIVFPPVLSIIFPAYQSALGLYRLMLFTMLPMSFAATTGAFFVIRGQKSLTWLTAIRIVCICVFTFLFTKLFGIYGLALEFFMSVGIFAWLRQRELARLLPGYSLRMSDILSIDADDRLIIQMIRNYLRKLLPRLKA